MAPPKQKKAPGVRFSLTWRVSSEGYQLSRDRKTIIRLGDKFDSYDAAQSDPSVHFEFVTLDSRVKFAEDQIDPDAFESQADAALWFARSFGFLEDDQAKKMDVEDFWNKQTRASMFCASEFLGFASNEDAITHFRVTPPRVQVGLARTDYGVSLELRPLSLLDWIWVKIAHDYISDVRYDGKLCLSCSVPIPRGSTSAGAKRSDAAFCGPACRMRFYRAHPNQKRPVKSKGKRK